MVAGLIAMRILPHESCDVRLNATCGFDWCSEQGFKACEISLVTAQDVTLSAHVMNRRKEVLPSIGLCEVKIHFTWVKTLNPSTLPFG